MKLTESEIALLRESYALLAENAEAAGATFYSKLFELAPEVRSLFRADIRNQGMRFFGALKAILDKLEDPRSLDESLRHLATGHAAVGIRVEHFKPMGEALIETMRATLGDDLTPEAEAAWRKAYAQIAEAMIATGQIAGGPA